MNEPIAVAGSDIQKPGCWACRYYRPGNGQNVEQGICRKNPPVAHPIVNGSQASTLTVWPTVNHGTDWCGEFSIDLGKA